MAVVNITSTEVIERFPNFAPQATLIDKLIPEAKLMISDAWTAEEQTMALLYLVAHMLVTEGSADSLPVISESLGPISTTYAYPANKDPLLLTEYGRRFVMIRNRNTGGGGSIVVVGGCT